MRVTPAKLAANRRNAQKSTGPKTPEGKRKSSMNAVKHGLYCKKLLIDSPALKENPEEYQKLRQSLIDDLKPVGAVESALVDDITKCIWLHQRAENAEIAADMRQFEELITGSNDCMPDMPADFDAAITDGMATCNNIVSYEMRLTRRLSHMQNYLIYRQACRQIDLLQKLWCRA